MSKLCLIFLYDQCLSSLRPDLINLNLLLVESIPMSKLGVVFVHNLSSVGQIFVNVNRTYPSTLTVDIVRVETVKIIFKYTVGKDTGQRCWPWDLFDNQIHPSHL